jgi:signal transduction histidine kinase
MVQELGQHIDFLAWELRPAVLDDLGLAAALPRFVSAWSEHVGTPAEFRLHGDGRTVAHDVEVAFYRVAQEALNNAAKHAHPSRVDVVLTVTPNETVMVIEDDGVGFDFADQHAGLSGIGLASMRERAALVGASLDIESVPGKGTAVYMRASVNGSKEKGTR